MSASGSILPIPKWYFVGFNGKPLGGGFFYTQLQSDISIQKLVFQDPGLTTPYQYTAGPRGQAILLDLNGTTGPMFWANDVPYYIYVTDAQDNLIWDMQNFWPTIAGGGGGGNTTTLIDIENLVVNGAFYRHIGTDNVPFATAKLLTLAPGAHAGLSAFAASANANGPAGADISFVKNNLAATDTLTFRTFSSNELGALIATPQYYLTYSCTAAGAGETYKYLQIPITSGAVNLSNQPVSVVFWYKWVSGDNHLTPYLRQFYGDGSSASTDTFNPPFPVPQITLVTDAQWHKVVLNFTVPNYAGKTPGQCGNDGLFLQIEYPLTVECNISITKPAMYLGTFTPTDLGGTEDYHTNDQIEAVANEFRTGDIRSTLNAFAPMGWVAMNDGSIGSLTSGATARADRDTFPLYNLLWNSVTSQTNGTNVSGGGYAQLYDSAGTPLATVGASAVADFSANRRLGLTKTLGRVLAGTLNTEITQGFTTNFAVNNQLTVGSAAGFYTGAPVVITTSGTLSAPLAINTTYYAIFIDATHIALATSPENAFAGTQITLTTNGTGQTVQVTPYALGKYLGEEKHTQTIAEMASHHHTVGISNIATGVTGGGAPAFGGSINTSDVGSSTPFNVMQPTTFVNMIIKL